MVPEGWKSFSLGHLYGFKNGLNADKDSYGHGTPFVNVMDIFAGNQLSADSLRGSVATSEKLMREFSVETGDVLFNRTSETVEEIAFSAVYVDTKPAVFGGFVIRGRPKSNSVDVLYSKYLFKSSSFRREAMKACQGAVRANIGQKDLSKIKITLPPRPEQKKISQILSTWDQAITATERLLENSQQRKKGLMQQLLTGKKRLPGFEGEFNSQTLSAAATITMGTSPKSSAYNSDEDGLPLLQGNADIEDRQSKPRVFTSEITKTCQPGNILLSVRAPVGSVAISNHEACIGRGICAIEAKSGSDQEFLYQWMLWYEPRWANLSQGSTFESVNSADIKNLLIKLPAFAEQQAISKILSVSDRESGLLKVRLKNLKQEKKGLMQQLLTGKRRVQMDTEAA